MICIPVASSTTLGKRYATRSFDDLEQLRAAIAATGRQIVSLVSTNRWDDSWQNHQSIPVVSLGQEYLDWLAAPAEESRYLVCGL